MKIQILYCSAWGYEPRAARLAALIKERLDIDVALDVGKSGQFDVMVDGETITSRGGNMLTRLFGAGWPDPEDVLAAVELRLAKTGA